MNAFIQNPPMLAWVSPKRACLVGGGLLVGLGRGVAAHLLCLVGDGAAGRREAVANGDVGVLSGLLVGLLGSSVECAWENVSFIDPEYDQSIQGDILP